MSLGEPNWLTAAMVRDFHSEQLALFGGPDGVRDVGLLESALARPLNKWSYGETDLAKLAAAYAFGLSGNHPFLDGNKRTAFTAMIVLLGLNGCALETPRAEATAAMLALAAGELDEEALARWIATHMRPRA